MHAPSTRSFALVIALVLGGCSRHAPETFSTDSPASFDAVAAPVAEVTLALDGDPPLPGEATTKGWNGLTQPTAPAHEHHGHHGHHGHAEGGTDAPR